MILGSYQVIEELGSGTFGTVLKVKDTRTSETVAIKCISKNKIQRNKMGDQVKKEINTMKVLRHPNIIQIKDVLMDKTYLYITMEYVGGGELYRKIALGGKMPESVARGYFRQVMEGLRYCHELNICHRDIKPENILLDDKDVVKIADFGFASIMEIDDYKKPSIYSKGSSYMSSGNQDDSMGLKDYLGGGEEFRPPARDNFKRMESKIMRKLSTICGTSMYMAPEITKRAGYFGDKADIWSCGVVLYYLIMHALPFDEDEFDINSKRICEGSYKLSPHLSKEVKDLMSNLLKYDPSKRYSARKALNHAWFRIDGAPGHVPSKLLPVSEKEPRSLSQNLPAITEVSSSYSGKKSMVSKMDIRSCVSRSAGIMGELSWMYNPPSDSTTSLKASKMADTGMALIQLSFEESSDGSNTVTIISLDIFGDNTSSGSSDIEVLMNKVQEETCS